MFACWFGLPPTYLHERGDVAWELLCPDFVVHLVVLLCHHGDLLAEQLALLTPGNVHLT